MSFHQFKRAYEKVAEDPYRRFVLCESAGLAGPLYDGEGNDLTLEVLAWVEPLVIATEKAVHLAHAPREEDLSSPTLHDIAMLKDRIDRLEERVSSGFKERPRCVDCGAAISKGKCRCDKCSRLKPIEVDCPSCNPGPYEDVPRPDCPTCHGTGKYEVL